LWGSLEVGGGATQQCWLAVDTCGMHYCLSCLLSVFVVVGTLLRVPSGLWMVTVPHDVTHSCHFPV
jgi:hypothetical protein